MSAQSCLVCLGECLGKNDGLTNLLMRRDRYETGRRDIPRGFADIVSSPFRLLISEVAVSLTGLISFPY